jgi:hypothetical protein
MLVLKLKLADKLMFALKLKISRIGSVTVASSSRSKFGTRAGKSVNFLVTAGSLFFICQYNARITNLDLPVKCQATTFVLYAEYL